MGGGDSVCGREYMDANNFATTMHTYLLYVSWV